jgi:glycosyltransferase involved in cell wall biosynthesis
MDKKVSVIIPVYNSEDYIAEAIESVTAQTYKNIEIIVVNDGSTDNTEAVLKPYMEKIKYFYQENKGVAAARNTGIRLALGEYIAFLDSDDIWLPEKIALQVDYLNRNPSVMLTYSNFKIFNDGKHPDEGILYLNSDIYIEGYIFTELVNACLISTITVLVRKEVFEKVGLFDEKFVSGEDYELWLRIAAECKIGYVKEVLASCRKHSQSITTNIIGPEKPWEIKAIENVLQKYPEKILETGKLQIKKRYSQIYNRYGYSYFNISDYKSARYHYWKLLRYNPINIKAYFYLVSSLFFPKYAQKIANWLKDSPFKFF